MLHTIAHSFCSCLEAARLDFLELIKCPSKLFHKKDVFTDKSAQYNHLTETPGVVQSPLLCLRLQEPRKRHGSL